MITEEQKQEAERVVDKYKNLTTYQYQEYAGANPSTFEHDKDTLCNCAIQDRRSVLEELSKVESIYKSIETTYQLQVRIQSLTAQIDYLKSKL